MLMLKLRPWRGPHEEESFYFLFCLFLLYVNKLYVCCTNKLTFLTFQNKSCLLLSFLPFSHDWIKCRRILVWKDSTAPPPGDKHLRHWNQVSETWYVWVSTRVLLHNDTAIHLNIKTPQLWRVASMTLASCKIFKIKFVTLIWLNIKWS